MTTAHDITFTLNDTHRYLRIIEDRGGREVWPLSNLQAFTEVTEDLAGFLGSVVARGRELCRVPKYRLQRLIGAVSRLSRGLRKRAVDYVISETKAALASCEEWRLQVIEDLGGDDSLQAWEEKAEEVRKSKTAKPLLDYELDAYCGHMTVEDIDAAELEAGLYQTPHMSVTTTSTIPTDREGIFRLAPKPRFPREIDLHKAYLRDLRDTPTRGPNKEVVLDFIFPIALTPDELRVQEAEQLPHTVAREQLNHAHQAAYDIWTVCEIGTHACWCACRFLESDAKYEDPI